MTYLDETTSRADLEIAAIFECNIDCAIVETATDEELLSMVRDWVAAGDECEAA